MIYSPLVIFVTWCIIPSHSAASPFRRSLVNSTGIEAAREGLYEVDSLTYRLFGVVDNSNPYAVVIYPKQILLNDPPTQKFPLLIFSHGFMGGNRGTYPIHQTMFQTVASFGFIIIAPRSCSFGCPSFGKWSTYFEEQLNLIQWAASTKGGSSQRQDTRGILQFVDHDAGYGVFGHSMGAQATARTLDNVTRSFAINGDISYDIRAGVLLHPPPTEDSLEISVPMAAFTGSLDQCCGESSTKALYDIANGPKAYANMIDAEHAEPTSFGENRWSVYIAAWFKVYLLQSSTLPEDYLYYSNLIYGSDPTSLCGGSIPMKEDCETIR